MRLVRNLLALIGVLALITIGAAILVLEPYASKARSLDEAALGVYSDVVRTILTTGDAIPALVYQQRVAPGRTVEAVERSLERAAGELGLQSLGMLPIQRAIPKDVDRTFPLLQIYLFCDPDLAVDLIRHNAAMAAYLPCRVTLYEDARGGLWVMTQNLDLVLHGGRPLPIALQERAAGLQALLREMVDRAAGTEALQGAESRTEHILAGFPL